MHDYLFTSEVVRFAFMFGVAVSMLLYERRHLTTGSIVVPGYIATFIAMPLTIVATFLNAFISYWLINKVLRRWFLLYGRTKFTVLASTSILIQTLMLKFSPVGSWLWEKDFKLLVGVGYVVPALIAHDMGRQGIKKTIKSVMLAGLIVAAPIGVALLLHVPGVNDLAPLRGGFDSAVDVGWIPIAVLFSAAAAWGVGRNLGLRSGGFMGAVFIAILLGDPWQVVVAACTATATYLIVKRLLMNSMILFGRRKFSAMLLVSASLSWSLLWLGSHIFAVGIQSHMDTGSLALTPLIVPGLLANDAQRTSPLRVLAGTSLATTFVLAMTWSIQSVVEDRHLDAGWRIIALASGALIFGRPVYVALRRLVAGGTRATVAAVAGPERAVPVAVAVEPAHGFGGYDVWAVLHRDAAEAAERWLAAILGESPRPTLAMAAAPVTDTHHMARQNAENRAIDRLRVAAVRALRAPVPAPPPRRTAPIAAAPPQAANRNAESRAVDKLREAAVRALDNERRSAEQQPLPVRHKALPLRHRPQPPTSGDLNAVTVTVARATAPYEELPEMSGAVHAAHAAPDSAGDPGR
jgi:poly-gamma-glutamate biosynthesis protein PgsC/CapC